MKYFACLCLISAIVTATVNADRAVLSVIMAVMIFRLHSWERERQTPSNR